MIELHQTITEELENITQLLTEEQEASKLTGIIKRFKIDVAEHRLREEKDAIPLVEKYLDEPNERTKSKLIQMIEKLLTEHDLFDELIQQLDSMLQERDYSKNLDNKINHLKKLIHDHDQQAKEFYKKVIN